MNRTFVARVTALCAAALPGSDALAQVNNPWVGFARDPARVQAGVISDANHETDLAWGDLDQDGFIDLVVVRKQPYTSPGKRTNVLLMNVSGVLTDQTAQFAVASDVSGDQGFLTPTNDRDVALADVDQDGWLDVVTATTISDGDPKHVGHPRIYRNLQSGAGWNGLRHEDARVPQLLHYGTGLAENPRFCSVSAGDLTGDGAPELYFGDYDSSGAGGAQQPANKDLNDRLLVNDGNGFFTDQSQARMTAQMLNSAFGMSTAIVDMNMDGRLDVVKDTALNPPQHVAISYNDLFGSLGAGSFNAFQVVHTHEPYHLAVGDLNNDGRPDLAVTDDGADRYRFHAGLDALGRATFGPARKFDFLFGGDDGFGGNNLIADLDGDGWNDVIITDQDVDIFFEGTRTHIYHNLGGPGQQGLDVVLREERQDQSNFGWIGVPGLTSDDLARAHDVAVFDIDNDGDQDLTLSRTAGTEVFVQGPPTPITCQTNLGFQSGTPYLSVCGGDLTAGNDATLEIQGLPFFGQNFLFVGTGTNPIFVPELNATLATFPLATMVPFTTFGATPTTLPVAGGFSGLSVSVQVATVFSFNPLVYHVSNAVRIDWP